MECHCQDEAIKIVVKRYPVIMKLLETLMTDLPLELTVQQAFIHIISNILDVMTTQEDYSNTLGVMLGRTYSANGTETLGGYLNKIEADALVWTSWDIHIQLIYSFHNVELQFGIAESARWNYVN